MKQVNIYEAKTRLSQLVDEAYQGKTIVIAKSGTPMAKLAPLSAGKGGRIRFGLMKGQIKIAKDFDAPPPEDILASFEGRSDK